MTATAPPPGTMARRAILRTAVPAMTAPGQPRHAARCPAGTFPARHAAPAHGAGNAQGPGPGRTRPFSGTVADAPSPRTRPPFPSRPAAVPIPPLAALRPCSPCRTARQRRAASTAAACGPGTRYRAVSARRPVRGSVAGRQNRYSSPSGLRPASSRKSAHRGPGAASAAGAGSPGKNRTGPLSAARAGQARYRPSSRASSMRMTRLLRSFPAVPPAGG